eukprot:4357291-Amphidinium_carterae.1
MWDSPKTASTTGGLQWPGPAKAAVLQCWHPHPGKPRPVITDTQKPEPYGTLECTPIPSNNNTISDRHTVSSALILC